MANSQDKSSQINDEGLRIAANLGSHYDTWLSAARSLERDGRLAWKRIADREYLYAFINRRNDGKSLGPRSAETEARMREYEAAKAAETNTWNQLRTDCAIYRSLRLPQMPSYAAKVLRQLDIHRLLGDSVLVVGTNALAAYAIEAGRSFPSDVDTTADFDLSWVRPRGTPAPDVGTPSLLGVLKQIDNTYTINMERTFQARNSKGEEVELLISRALGDALPPYENFSPVPLPEQDWLLPGMRVGHVVCGLDATPARIVAPDPRWFALHKSWLADKPTRDPLKRKKDRLQGRLVLDMAADHMPRFPIDEAFERSLPAELKPYLDAWRERAQ